MRSVLSLLGLLFLVGCGEIQTHTSDLCDVQSSGDTIFMECNDGTSIVAETTTNTCTVK